MCPDINNQQSKESQLFPQIYAIGISFVICCISSQNVISGIGGVHALFPILENASSSDEGPDLSFLSPSVEKEYRLIENHEGSVDSDEWEILPSSSYSGEFTLSLKL
jgi:hypothetical protein